jgi:hypothetical protein
MRHTLAFAMLAFGCASDPGMMMMNPPPGGDPPPPATGFQIVTPDIRLAAGEEKTYCYFTTLGIDQVAGVKRWSSKMTPGSHHMILYFTDTATQPDGTITESCGVTGGGLTNAPVWTYAAQTVEGEMKMPDGVGMTVKAKQPLFVQMHYLNASPNPLDAHVTINADTWAAGESYKAAAAYVTFNTMIDIAAGQTGSAQGSCTVPPTASFFTLSTHAHQFATHTEVKDGASTVFASDDWEHPGAADWMTAPHYSFSSGKMTYRCDYMNFSSARVKTGDSAKTDEMCMAVGYFFPAAKPIRCINSFVVP